MPEPSGPTGVATSRMRIGAILAAFTLVSAGRGPSSNRHRYPRSVARLRSLVAVCAVAAASVAGVALGAPVRADSPSAVITEVMASNTSTGAPCGGPFDWVEVRDTPGTDLGGMHLTDDPANPLKWTIPAATVIGASGYRIFCLQTGAADSPTFGLSKGGEYIALTNAAGADVGPTYTFPAQFDDVSWGTGSNATVGFMTTPTPGGANGPAQTQLSRLPRPVLSRAGGYISGPVTVTVTGQGTLRYTVDGTTPTSASPVVGSGGGITVNAGTILRVIAFGPVPSVEASATFLSTAGVMGQTTATPAGWPASGAVNGQRFVYGFDQSRVGPAVATALTSVPTLSIVTDQKNLTDPTTGIYVNATQSGSAWERGASIEYIQPGGGSFQINAGVRIKGGLQPSAAVPRPRLQPALHRLLRRLAPGGQPVR